jgi:hypothetical protein
MQVLCGDLDEAIEFLLFRKIEDRAGCILSKQTSNLLTESIDERTHYQHHTNKLSGMPARRGAWLET